MTGSATSHHTEKDLHAVDPNPTYAASPFSPPSAPRHPLHRAIASDGGVSSSSNSTVVVTQTPLQTRSGAEQLIVHELIKTLTNFKHNVVASMAPTIRQNTSYEKETVVGSKKGNQHCSQRLMNKTKSQKLAIKVVRDMVKEDVVPSTANVSMSKRLTKKSFLLGLETVTLSLDHNNDVLATLVSCLLNRSPNLKDLRIIGSRRDASSVPLAAEFREKQINADRVLNHLSSFTFIESPFQDHPCGGLCRSSRE